MTAGMGSDFRARLADPRPPEREWCGYTLRCIDTPFCQAHAGTLTPERAVELEDLVNDHELTTTEIEGRGETTYRVTCSCGWRRFGFEYRLQADREGREHHRRVIRARWAR